MRPKFPTRVQYAQTIKLDKHRMKVFDGYNEDIYKDKSITVKVENKCSVFKQLERHQDRRKVSVVVRISILIIFI